MRRPRYPPFRTIVIARLIRSIRPIVNDFVNLSFRILDSGKVIDNLWDAKVLNLEG